jgi:hypothetical protein
MKTGSRLHEPIDRPSCASCEESDNAVLVDFSLICNFLLNFVHVILYDALSETIVSLILMSKSHMLTYKASPPTDS